MIQSIRWMLILLALVVGFTSSYVLENYSLQDSIRRGQITARWTCTQKSNSSNLMKKEMLDTVFSKQIQTGGLHENQNRKTNR